MNIRSLLIGVIPTLMGAAVAHGAPLQAPLEDSAFSPATPSPDFDLVVVCERSYGAGGVDLTSYGIGGGPVDYVQSIYFRLFKDNNTQTFAAVAGRVVFPPGVTILGVITNRDELGGELDDGLLTETDELFAIGVDPDLYSEDARGFESSGLEFVCPTNDLRSLVFGLIVTGGVDDFRVIVDYGDSFPQDLAFDVAAYDVPSVSGVPPSLGYIVGDAANPSVPGSGDFGEAESLLGIPLTSTAEPTTGCDLPVSPDRNVFVLRDTSGDTQIDGFDVDLLLPGPELFTIDVSTLSNPVALTAGPDGLLYAFASGAGYAVVDVRGGVTNEQALPGPAGTRVDVAFLPGERLLYVARDTSDDTHVDVLDVDSLQWVEDVAVPAAWLGTPVGITEASDGMLYVCGQGGGFVRVDPVMNTVTSFGHSGSFVGTYVDVTGHPAADWIYLLRDTSGDSHVDRFHLGTASFEYDWASFQHPGSPVALSLGPDGMLYVQGVGGTGPGALTALDPDTGTAEPPNVCADFPGSNVDIAFTVPGPAGIYCSAKTNSQGCDPSIASSGAASVSDPTPFWITCDQVLNNQNGILFYGYGPNSATLQGGTLCVQAPIKRTPVLNSGGNPPPADCSGSFARDFNAWIQSGIDPALQPCTSVYAQIWYRDPPDPAGFGSGLSNALEFEIGL